MPDLKVRRNDCHAVSECEYLFYEAKTVLRLKKASKSAVWWHHVCVYEAPPSLVRYFETAVHIMKYLRGDFIMSSPQEQLMPARKSHIVL